MCTKISPKSLEFGSNKDIIKDNIGKKDQTTNMFHIDKTLKQIDFNF